MGLLSKFKRQDDAAPDAAAPPDAVSQARTVARRRLVGASVLLAIGIIGFPLLFETQPRPIAIDIPIEIPRRENAPPLALPPARPTPAVPADVAEPPTPAETSPKPAGASPPMPEKKAGAESLPPATKPPAGPSAAAVPATPAAPANPPPTQPSAGDEARRARALLEGKPAAAPKAAQAPVADAVRVVVQVGAYSDEATLRAARQKVEAMGLKTFIQVVQTDGGKRTRVRVGPFTDRGEAEKVAARIKSAGLPVVVLTL